MVSQWDPNNADIMLIILAIIWIIAIVVLIVTIKQIKNNPYPFCYLVDYNTLVKYMQEEDKFAFENKLESSFHFNLYRNNEVVEIQAWHYCFSSFDSEKTKGNVYYWNKEKFYSLDNFIDNKISYFDGYVLIELIDCDNVMLNEYKKNHKELDVVAYIEKRK